MQGQALFLAQIGVVRSVLLDGDGRVETRLTASYSFRMRRWRSCTAPRRRRAAACSGHCCHQNGRLPEKQRERKKLTYREIVRYCG